MNTLKKRIIIAGSSILLIFAVTWTYLHLGNDAGNNEQEGSKSGEMVDMTGDAACMTAENDGLIKGELLCEADVTEPDEMTLLSLISVGERINIGSYGSEEIGWIVYDEDENCLYLISEKVIDARPMENNTDIEMLFDNAVRDGSEPASLTGLYEMIELSCEVNEKFTDTDLCEWLNDEFLSSVFSKDIIEKMQPWNDGIKITLPDDDFVTNFTDYLWAGSTQAAAENGVEIFDTGLYTEFAGEVRDPMTGEVIPEDEIHDHSGLIYPTEAEGSASYALSSDITDGNVSIRSFGFTRRNAGLYENVGIRPMIKILK